MPTLQKDQSTSDFFDFNNIHYGLTMMSQGRISRKDPKGSLIRTATRGKAAKAWSLARFSELESGGSSGGAPAKWPPLWLPCLPKIYRGGPNYLIDKPSGSCNFLQIYKVLKSERFLINSLNPSKNLPCCLVQQSRVRSGGFFQNS